MYDGSNDSVMVFSSLVRYSLPDMPLEVENSLEDATITRVWVECVSAAAVQNGNDDNYRVSVVYAAATKCEGVGAASSTVSFLARRW